METRQRKSDIVFYLLMTAAMLLWSGSWISGKLVSSAAGPEILVFWRFSLSFLSFLPITAIAALRSRKPAEPGSRHRTGSRRLIPVFWIVLSAILLITYNRLFFSALSSGLAGKGGMIVTTLNPLFSLLIAIVFLKERLNALQTTGLVLGVFGGLILIEPWSYTMEELITGGNLLFLSAALAWALLTTASHKAQHYFSPVFYNFFLYGSATVINLVFFSDADTFAVHRFSANFWINTCYLAFLGGSVGAGLYFFAAKKIGSGKAGSFTFLVPGLAVLLAWIILDEIPEMTTIVGGIMAVSAVWLINRAGKDLPQKLKER